MPACAHCGEGNPPEARLCWSCGTVLPAADRPGGEERRVVTVLFVDLVDFTGISTRLDPEDLRRVQAPYFRRVRAELERFGGHVEKYIGDAVMALFGAPVATETDAVRCVRAGLELQRVLDQYAEGGLRCRVGVTTGDALVDVAAARDGGQAIVAGDVVNIAARLQSLAPPGGVLVSGATYAATKSMIRYAAQAPVTLDAAYTTADESHAMMEPHATTAAWDGDRVTLGAKSGVHADIPADSRMLGAPATPDREQMRILMSLEKLPELRKEVKRIKHHLGLDDA